MGPEGCVPRAPASCTSSIRQIIGSCALYQEQALPLPQATVRPAMLAMRGRRDLRSLAPPTACSLDTAGNLFLADTGNHVVRRSPRTASFRPLPGRVLPAPAGMEARGIAVDDDGDIYIS